MLAGADLKYAGLIESIWVYKGHGSEVAADSAVKGRVETVYNSESHRPLFYQGSPPPTQSQWSCRANLHPTGRKDTPRAENVVT